VIVASSASPWSLSGAGTTASAASAAPLGGDRYASLSGLFADGDVAISEPAAAPSAPSASVNWNTVNWGGSTNSGRFLWPCRHPRGGLRDIIRSKG